MNKTITTVTKYYNNNKLKYKLNHEQKTTHATIIAKG